jgi:phage shock protein PspC (stress-responsive transcriptional regulator)
MFWFLFGLTLVDAIVLGVVVYLLMFIVWPKGSAKQR